MADKKVKKIRVGCKLRMKAEYSLCSKNVIGLGAILLLIVLLSGVSFVPAIHVGGTVQQVQQQQPQPPNQIGVSQIIKQIAEKVAAANPSTTAASVEQILTELAKLNALASGEAKGIEEIRQISYQVTTYPFGTVSQSLAGLANQTSADSTTLIPTIQKAIQEKSVGKKSITQSVVDTAVREASGGGKNVNDLISQAAQIIAKQAPGVPLQNIESIIIQMALQTSKAQGKAVTGQTIFEVANQIILNPNGVLTQAIIQLAKHDTHDGGKLGQTVNVIRTIVQETKKIDRQNGGGGDVNKPENQQLQPKLQPNPQPKLQPNPQPKLQYEPTLLDKVIISAGRAVIDLAFGKGTAESIDTVTDAITTANQHISKIAAQKTAYEFALQRGL